MKIRAIFAKTLLLKRSNWSVLWNFKMDRMALIWKKVQPSSKRTESLQPSTHTNICFAFDSKFCLNIIFSSDFTAYPLDGEGVFTIFKYNIIE